MILINDGSTDNTLDILDEYKNYPNVILINKKNEGVSATRNLGIKIARGDYVTFLDADDFIHPQYLERLYESMAYDVQMVLCGHSLVGNNDLATDSCILNKLNAKKLPKKAVLDYFMNFENCILGYSVRILYKTEILRKNNILFSTELKLLEDYQFVLNYLNTIEAVYIIADILYFYRRHENSATYVYNEHLEENQNNFMDWLYENIVKYNPKYMNYYHWLKACNYMSLVKNVYLGKGSILKFIFALKYVREIKSRENYNEYLLQTIRFLRNKGNSKKWLFLIGLLYFNLELIYICLYRMNLIFRKISNNFKTSK